jgi:glucose/arabinose dehydrogenase
MRNRPAINFVLLILAIGAAIVGAQEVRKAIGKPTVNRPQRIAFQPGLLQRLKVPSGFQVSVFASNTGEPRMMAVGPDGSVYVTRPQQADVIRLTDRNGDGKSDGMTTIASGIKLVHGIQIHNGKLYLAGVNDVYVSDLNGQNREKLIANLPDGGNHPNRTIGIGPDNQLYISIGSTCNDCDESNPEHATILKAPLNGGKRQIFARGLRNTIGFDWHPQTNELWGMDHGSDGRGDNQPPEELNRLQSNSDYGWPYCFGKKQPDPIKKDPKGTTKAEYCKTTIPIMLGYQAHSAPIEMIFYEGKQFPQDYHGDAFVAMHGSWNRSTPVGYKVARIRFENGKPQTFEDFLTGFFVGKNGQFGRPAGLAVSKDGSLLISDDENGVIYRVAYNAKIASK